MPGWGAPRLNKKQSEVYRISTEAGQGGRHTVLFTQRTEEVVSQEAWLGLGVISRNR